MTKPKTAISKLKKLVKPPKSPDEAEKDWARVEEELGHGLPSDYKKFIDAYGTGVFIDFFTIYSPFAKSRHQNFFRRNIEDLRAYRRSISKRMKTKYGLPEPKFELLLEDNAVLFWGVTYNEDACLWRTVGDPDQWSVIAFNSRNIAFEEFPEESMTSFLEGVTTGRIIATTLFPDDVATPPLNYIKTGIHEQSR